MTYGELLSKIAIETELHNSSIASLKRDYLASNRIGDVGSIVKTKFGYCVEILQIQNIVTEDTHFILYTCKLLKKDGTDFKKKNVLLNLLGSTFEIK